MTLLEIIGIENQYDWNITQLENTYHITSLFSKQIIKFPFRTYVFLLNTKQIKASHVPPFFGGGAMLVTAHVSTQSLNFKTAREP